MGMLKTVLAEIEQVLSTADEQGIQVLAQRLHQHQGRIFVLGEGRSGFMAKAFAMRLMHLGAEVYVIGETITPAIGPSDLVVAISGSGTTPSVVDRAVKARQLGCEIVAVTTDPQSPLGKSANLVFHIPAATKYRKEGEAESIQPLSSLFDQTTHILLDVVCLAFSELRVESNEQAVSRHSNME